MIEGNPAIVLNMLAIATLAFAVSGTAISVFVSLFGKSMLRSDIASRKRVLWLLASAPWTISLLVALLFLNCCFDVIAFQSNHSHNFMLIDWHYESNYSERAKLHHIQQFHWWSWRGFALLTAVSFCAYVVLKKSRELRQHRAQLTRLLQQSRSSSDGILVVQSANAFAFTTGFFKKHTFISSGLLAHTSPDEQRAILLHEDAHLRANDPIKKWIYSFLTAFFIPVLALRLRMLMTLSTEQEADAQVIKQDVEPTFMARTLVKVARLNITATPMQYSELVANFADDMLQQRVYFLLGKLELQPISKRFTSLFMLLILSVSLPSVDGVLYLMEALFKH
ncbi:M56 family metallopeptidase [Alteromonas sp. a30]|uniref:M56 family metallopeptidase n=1 Tax=Alteromonas sp. a30 TaxID=2730917 RepID=UPI002280ADB3|nr:M56 family metallopeptidase [Alteromonas sp. a30]MCY7295524.1 M56 family metallopeptidase [Alteromonas sp. a30]